MNVVWNILGDILLGAVLEILLGFLMFISYGAYQESKGNSMSDTGVGLISCFIFFSFLGIVIFSIYFECF